MATKRKFEDQEECEVVGYIHKVSEVTTASSSNTRYFNGTLQTNHNSFLRFVSFSPEKQATMKSAEKTKSPVKITNCTITQKGNNKEVIIRRSSNISVCKHLDFARSTKVEEVAKFLPLDQVETANTMCSVKVKVVSTSTTTLVQTKYGQRRIQKVKVADSTKSMMLALWQQHVDKLEPLQFYSIENLVSTAYQGEMQLSTTTKTGFRLAEEFRVTDTEAEEAKDTQSVGSILCCSLKLTSRCLNCKKPIDTGKRGEIVRCQHCSSKQKLMETQLAKTLSLQLALPAGVQKFVVFNDVLSSFLVKQNLITLNNDEIENHLLAVDQIMLRHKIGSDVVIEMNIEKEVLE